MTLRDSIETDASIFTNSDEFGESVVYRPRGGTARTISAVVFRLLPQANEDENRSLTVFEVHVANSSTTGIAASELNLGGDEIDLADRVGKTAKPRSIVQITEQDEGMLVLQCQ